MFPLNILASSIFHVYVFCEVINYLLFINKFSCSSVTKLCCSIKILAIHVCFVASSKMVYPINFPKSITVSSFGHFDPYNLGPSKQDTSAPCHDPSKMLKLNVQRGTIVNLVILLSGGKENLVHFMRDKAYFPEDPKGAFTQN